MIYLKVITITINSEVYYLYYKISKSCVHKILSFLILSGLKLVFTSGFRPLGKNLRPNLESFSDHYYDFYTKRVVVKLTVKLSTERQWAKLICTEQVEKILMGNKFCLSGFCGICDSYCSLSLSACKHCVRSYASFYCHQVKCKVLLQACLML